MIRIYCTKSTYESTISNMTPKHSIQVQRLEGGCWFSEETLDGNRATYRLQDRFMNQKGTIIEILSKLPDDFIEQPCWLHETLESWTCLREEESVVLWTIGDRLLLSFPIQQRWLPWMEALAGDAYKELQIYIMTNKPEILLPMSQPQQPCQDLIVPEKLVQPVLKQMAKSPLQMKKQTQSSSETRPVVPRVKKQVSRNKSSEGLAPQPQAPLLVSDAPKAVQSGLLCPPTLLPETPIPRKSRFHPPKRLSHVVSNRPTECLIDVSQS
jgi:hypothetical protein